MELLFNNIKKLIKFKNNALIKLRYPKITVTVSATLITCP